MNWKYAVNSLFLRVQMRASFILISVLVFLASCSGFNKVLKSKDNSLKYNKAMAYFDKKDYARSLQLLELLRESYRGNDSMESVYYYTAYCHYHLGDYEYASLFFKDYTENFSRSKRMVECAYMAVYCDYRGIGTYELDQSNTKIVIGELQTFINHYPNSSYAPLCNNHIDDLRKKLHQKEYEWVMSYFNQGHYRAAVTSARTTLKSYPDIDQKEELEYIVVKAQYLYAVNSIDKKKLERFRETLENWKEYNYINGNRGAFYKDALEIKDKTEKEIAKLTETI